MKRIILDQLIKWSRAPGRKPLILRGARQVGKTWLLKELGKNYEHLAYFNFDADPLLKSLFEASLKPKELIKKLQLYSGQTLTPKNTLLVFDEIQECPQALNSLKYFCEEAPEHHIACAGSLLGIQMSKEKGFPVGKVNFINIYPLSFMEFLSATEHNHLKQFLIEHDITKQMPQAFYTALLEQLKFYFFTGGMPEVVDSYVKNQNLENCRHIQNDILKSYQLDFAKHTPATDIPKVMKLWQSIPQQLAKENKKFVYSAISKNARAREYNDALQWLKDANLIYPCHAITKPGVPLVHYSSENFDKFYMLDVGLLGALSHLTSKTILTPNELFTEFKGALTENFVAQELTCYREQPLYYWTTNRMAEVDFIIENEGNVYPLEVKAGLSNRSKSLGVYNQKYQPHIAYRISQNNSQKDNIIQNLPLFALCHVK
ncbi:ATP-binding protein [bacterium]|nr:ATP-binding protein [bacterium]